MDLRTADDATAQREAMDRALREINTCIPGEIQSFDEATQRVTVIPAIRMRTNVDNKAAYLDLPPIVNAPLVIPIGSVGGFALTFPVKAGDPCLILFSQRGIDNWAETGGVQPPEQGIGQRHHDLTDAIVLLAPIPASQALGSWQQDGIELRNRDRTAYLKLQNEVISARTPTVHWTMNSSGKFAMTAPAGMDVDTPLASFTGDVVAGTVSLQNHTHPDPQGGHTGPPDA